MLPQPSNDDKKSEMQKKKEMKRSEETDIDDR